MKQHVTAAFVALAPMSLWPAFAVAQDQMQGQTPAQSNLASAYRGMIVCEKAPGAAGILHVCRIICDVLRRKT
jgi:hypothetical protein